MINSTYTLQRVARELNQVLVGTHLATCFTQVKDALVLGFASPEADRWVEIDVSGQRSSIFTHSEFHRARSNSIDMFEMLADAEVTAVVNPENERILEFQFEGKLKLVCVLFGRNSDNIFVVKSTNVVAALSNESELPEFGTRPALPLDNNSEQTVKTHLQQTRNVLGAELVKQVCERVGISTDTPMSALEPTTFLQLVRTIADIKNFVASADAPWCVDGTHLFQLRLAWLRECEHKPQDFNTGIAKVVMRNRGVAAIKDELDGAQRAVQRKIQKLQKQAAGINEEQARARIDMYRMYGHVLLGQPRGNERGTNELRGFDYEGNEITIPLKSKLSLHENAQAYFDKAKKSETEIVVRKKRQLQAESELEPYLHAQEELNQVHGYKALQKFYKQFPEFKPVMKDQANSTAQYREFDLGEGYVLYVGKDAASNDRLTLKFAKPHDIWLHARGCSGSHCILRGGDKDKKPPRHILDAAAEIAAYYSKARNGKHVPVAWTRKKYVRKPKGANVGAVIIDRETVVQVDPKLP